VITDLLGNVPDFIVVDIVEALKEE